MADFTWCMTAIDWGLPIEETAAKLAQVSGKTRERVQLRDEGYPLITAQNAAAAAERNALKRVGGRAAEASCRMNLIDCLPGERYSSE
jgi:hypothetical protein